MHDKNGTPLSVGDKVILTGTITEFTSEQPTYCNITMVSDEGMAPDVPGSTFALSARMVLKGKVVSQHCVHEVQTALRAAAQEIRGLRKALNDSASVAHAREDALQSTLLRLVNSGRGENSCTPFGMLGHAHGFEDHIDRIASSFDAAPEPADGIEAKTPDC